MPTRLPHRLLYVSALTILLGGAGDAMADSVSVRTGEHADHSRLVFDWDAPVAASVSQADSRTLILTFGRSGSFDLTKASTRKLKRVSRISRGDDGKTVHIALRAEGSFKLLNYDNTVVVDVYAPGAAPADGEAPGKVRKEVTITAKAGGPVALDAASLDYRHADELMPVIAAQGEPSAAPDAMGVQSAGAGPKPVSLDLKGPLPSPLFDIESWRGGGDFLTAFRDAAAELAGGENPEALLRLARLQFAWRHGDEGLAMMRRLAELDPGLAQRADVAALNEALALMAGRTQARRDVFAAGLFDESPEGLLWRGAAQAADHQWKDAAGSFARSLKALNEYPAAFRAHLALAAAEAALHADDNELAGKALKLAERSLADPADKAHWNALKGLQLVQSKDPGSAEPYLAAAASGEALRPRIIAQLALIDIGLGSGKLPPEKAALELEGLTYIWQGDELQLAILDRVIDTQASLGRFDRALEAADGAVLASPDAATQRKYRQRIGDLLQGALEASAAGAGDRLSTIALFDRYGEMLPGKEHRAELGLKLADQLAAADLKDQAADLLRQLKRTAPESQQPAIAQRLDIANPHMAAADADPAATAALALPAPEAPTGGDPDSLWRDKRWSEAADAYLSRIAGSSGKARPRLILRAAAALMLAGRNRELAALGQNFSAEMKDSALAGPFQQLTAPGADYSVLIAPEMAKALTVTQ